MFSSHNDEPMSRMNYSQNQMGRGLDSRGGYGNMNGNQGNMPVLELRVPMCCEKCQEKVKEELEELEGVRSVHCDQYNQRVTVTGFVDPLRALKKVKKVKKKSEFFNAGSYINHVSNSSRHNNNSSSRGSSDDHDIRYTGKPLIRSNSFGRSSNYNGNGSNYNVVGGYGGGGGQLVRSNSFGRNLSRLPSFGKVIRYDGDRQHDYAPRNLQQDTYGVRRMPSFKRYRNHDAEYISMGDQYTPQMSETRYVPLHNQRPVFRSQVSFSKLPVGNPHYMKHIESEYY